jgi:hypothetical protein
VVAKKKDMVLGGFSSLTMNFDCQPMFEKGLRLYAVSDGFDYTEVAINMLVHGAINLENFETQILTDFDPAVILKERYDNIASISKLTICKLIL